MSKYYILNGRETVPCDVMTWARWFENSSERIVKKTTTQNGEVSTVFLGPDHSYGEGPPMIFETLVFGGTMDQTMDRYATMDEAEAGHAAMVDRVTVSAEVQK